MPAPWGVTPTGFNKKTADDIQSELQAAELANIDPALNVKSPSSVIGQLNGIFGDKVRELWDVSEAVYKALYPDSAEGDGLDNVCSINGVVRLAATFSTVVVHCTGTPGTVLAAGRIVQTSNNVAQFTNPNPATIGGGGFVDVPFHGTTTGPLAAPAGTLTLIVTPVAGWAAATNALDAALGTNEEQDPALRARRLDVLAIPGAGTIDAVLAAVTEVPSVTEVLVFENSTSFVDVNGLPPHSFETVVEGGDNTAIATAIASKKAGGIQAYGTTVVVIADSLGNSHSIGFSRPAIVDIYIDITVAVKLAQFGNGDQNAGILLVQTALADAGNLLNIGDEVVRLEIMAAALTVPGVKDIPVFKIDTVFPPLGVINIPITNHQEAEFDTSRIRVTVVPFV